MTARGDAVSLTFKGREVARCGLAEWRAAVGALETAVNRRLATNRCIPGRFPRREGSASVAFAFTGEVFSLIDMLGRTKDVEASLQQWLSMHAYIRGAAFRQLERQIRQEERAAA